MQKDKKITPSPTNKKKPFHWHATGLNGKTKYPEWLSWKGVRGKPFFANASHTLRCACVCSLLQRWWRLPRHKPSGFVPERPSRALPKKTFSGFFSCGRIILRASVSYEKERPSRTLPKKTGSGWYQSIFLFGVFQCRNHYKFCLLIFCSLYAGSFFIIPPPWVVWVFIISNSSWVRRPGLFKIESGITIFPISCRVEADAIHWIILLSKLYSG